MDLLAAFEPVPTMFQDTTDLFMFIGLLVVMAMLFLHAVYKIVMAIKGDK